jgi:pilus assembly protein CpaE
MTAPVTPQRLHAVVALAAGMDPVIVEGAVTETAGLEVAGFMHDLDPERGGLERIAGDVLVIACTDEASDKATELIREFNRRHPNKPVIVLVGGTPNGFVTRAIEVGADDVLRLPSTADEHVLRSVGEQIAFALQKAIARKDGGAAVRRQAGGRMICVLGPKGGIGKTLTAANLAVSFAEAGHSAVIVDLDLQFGDVGLLLGLSPHKTIYDLARSSGSLDAEKVEAFMAVHESGLRALLAPTRPDQASSVTAEFLTGLYATLRDAYDFVVVDTPPSFAPEVITSIDNSSNVCIVGMLDSLALKNTKLGLETLDLMGYPPDRVRLVLNRADTRVGITNADVTTIVGREPDVFVPSSRDIARSVNDGRPIAMSQPRSEAGRAFRGLAAIYEQAEQDAGRANGKRRAFTRRRR